MSFVIKQLFHHRLCEWNSFSSVLTEFLKIITSGTISTDFYIKKVSATVEEEIIVSFKTKC